MECFWDETTNDSVKGNIRLKIEDEDNKGESIEELELYFIELRKIRLRKIRLRKIRENKNCSKDRRII